MRACANARLLVHTITLEEKLRTIHASYFHVVVGRRTRLLAKNIKMTVKDGSDERTHCGARLPRHRFHAYEIVGNGRGRGLRGAARPVLPDAAELPTKLDEPVGQAFPAVSMAIVPQQETPQVQIEMGVELCRDEVATWLVAHGFESVSDTFAEYNGTDMMRLTRDDLVTMCGLPNGIRLFYALRSKPAIRLVVYVSVSNKSFYHALYLKSATAAELANQLATLLNIPQLPGNHVFLLGPNNIHVVVSDDVVANLANETAFVLQLLKDEASDRCCVLLRATAPPPAGQ